MRVLVVDDEPEIRRLMSHALSSQGMIVDTAGDGAAALERLREQSYNIVLLDMLMPDTSGLDLLPEVLRTRPGQRVMMISALNEPRTRVKCLELGAVDYVTKPFVLAELLARVRIHARRTPAEPVAPVERRRQERRVGSRRTDDRSRDRDGLDGGQDSGQVRAAGATLDLRGRRVHIGGQAIALSERESLVLAYLMRRSGEICARQEILRDVWGSEHAQNANVVDVYVGRLRAKLPADSITTFRNAGYAFGAA